MTAKSAVILMSVLIVLFYTSAFYYLASQEVGPPELRVGLLLGGLLLSLALAAYIRRLGKDE